MSLTVAGITALGIAAAKGSDTYFMGCDVLGAELEMGGKSLLQADGSHEPAPTGTHWIPKGNGKFQLVDDGEEGMPLWMKITLGSLFVGLAGFGIYRIAHRKQKYTKADAAYDVSIL